MSLQHHTITTPTGNVLMWWLGGSPIIIRKLNGASVNTMLESGVLSDVNTTKAGWQATGRNVS